MRKLSIVFYIILSMVSCALTSGKSISSSDLKKFRNGSLGLSDLTKRYGQPMMSMNGTNDGGFYSPKCGKRSEPITILQYSYSKVNHKMISM